MQKRTTSYHILRIGMAITFLWIGILIFRDPELWGSQLLPWASNLLPVPLKQAMLGAALLDIGVGFLLLIDVLPWIAAMLAAFHLVMVLTTVGINAVTVRDIGLLAGTIALAATTWPDKFRFWQKRDPKEAEEERATHTPSESDSG